MLIFLLAIGSTALLAGSFSNDDTETKDDISDANERLEDLRMVDRGPIPGVMETDSEKQGVRSIKMGSDDEFVVKAEFISIAVGSEEIEMAPDEVRDLILNDLNHSLPNQPEYVSLNISETEMDAAIPPLSDWASDPSIPTLNLGETDIVYANLEPHEGSIRIMRADYFERLGSEENSDIHSIYTGANIYYLPSGEEFPSDYIWSESGASLYNFENSENDEADFGEIMLVYRIDTGSIYSEIDSATAKDFSDRAFAELQERFTSNGNFRFLP